MNPIIPTIIHVFETRGTEAYGSEAVNQLEHALQCASMAVESGAAPALVTAALLHDIGHILGEQQLPADDHAHLDDRHEERAHPWLLEHFGPAVADPVRLHVAAKRYLCTVDSSYVSALSPTSLKSYHDQGGNMSDAERAAFEAEPHFRDAVTLRRWDDLGKTPELSTPSVGFFVPYLERSLRL
jgi:phosphonate degradation associated HDIG domain protein